MGEVDNLIAVINPDEYYADKNDKSKLNEFKKLIKEKGFLAASKSAKPKSLLTHKIVYETYAESLEPTYYWIIDFMKSDFGMNAEKLIDNFSPTPGSSEFGELGTRWAVMQQQASGMLEKINAVLKSILNIVYDLKDFKLRLQSYDDLHSSDENTRKAARLSLKQIWLDKVDISRGNSSIKGMIAQGNPIILHAFLAADSSKDVNALDLNEVTKRILFPRVQEFNNWLEQSEIELRNRYKIEKNYLGGQVASLKLYSRWAKPYLESAQKLEQGQSKDAALVKAFNRTLLQVTLLGKVGLDVKDEAVNLGIPADFSKDRFASKIKREYFSCILVDFKFRAVPQKMQSGGAIYTGRVDVAFDAYALNQEELNLLNELLEESDMNDSLKLIKNITDDSLKELQKDIDFFLNDDGETSVNKKEKSSDESNPFLALFGFYNKEEKKEVKKEKEVKKVVVQPENWHEREIIRPRAGEIAKGRTYLLFDVYKKAHGMPSYDKPL